MIEVRDATSDLSKPVVPAFEQNPDAVLFDKMTLYVECDSKVNSKDVDSRRYFAIEAVNGEEYQYVMSVAKNNDDIIIDISNPKKKAEK